MNLWLWYRSKLYRNYCRKLNIKALRDEPTSEQLEADESINLDDHIDDGEEDEGINFDDYEEVSESNEGDIAEFAYVNGEWIVKRILRKKGGDYSR